MLRLKTIWVSGMADNGLKFQRVYLYVQQGCSLGKLQIISVTLVGFEPTIFEWLVQQPNELSGLISQC